MEEICHIKSFICDFDYEIKKSSLIVESEYFHQHILQNPKQTIFIIPRQLEYEKETLIIFFSELENKRSGKKKV